MMISIYYRLKNDNIKCQNNTLIIDIYKSIIPKTAICILNRAPAFTKMSTISMNELYNYCQTDSIIPFEMINQLDELTFMVTNHKFNADHSLLNSQCWKAVAGSVKLWENLSLILSQNTRSCTKIHALMIMCKRIKDNWFFQDPQIKENIKKYACNQAQNYNYTTVTPDLRVFYRKINDIIIEILKYQWMGEWSSYLSQVCSALYDNCLVAENYFDLLKAIFEEIFAEEKKLTTEELSKLRDHVVENYSCIQKCFQKYLVPQAPAGAIIKALNALQQIVQWIPAYYIYFGQIIQKLLQLVKLPQPQFIENSSKCLALILTLPNDQNIVTFLGKSYDKKRTILVQLLTLQLNKKQNLTSIIFQAVLHFLMRQKQDIKKYGYDKVFIGKQSQQMNIFILQQLAQIIEQCMYAGESNKNGVVLSDQTVSGLVKYILTVVHADSTVRILDNIISITPCPIDTDFYSRNKLFKKQSQDCLTQDRNSIIQTMKVLIQTEQQTYIQYMMQLLNKNSQDQTPKLIKRIWSLYYYLNINTLQINRMVKVTFAVINKLLSVQETLEQDVQFNAQTKSKFKVAELVTQITVIKHSIILILSNAKCIQNQMLAQPLKCSIISSFNETNSFIKAILDILRDCYHKFNPLTRQQIHGAYFQAMKNRQGRLQCDLVYVQLVSKWVGIHGGNIQEGVTIVQDVMGYYRVVLQTIRKKKINTKDAIKAQQAQKHYFQSTFNFLKMIHICLPYFKSQMVYALREDTLALRQSQSMFLGLTNSYIDTSQFFKLAVDILKWNFSLLKLDQIQKNIQTVVIGCQQQIQFIFKLFDCRARFADNQSVINSGLQYLAEFIAYIWKWSLDNHQYKVPMVNKIINSVLNSNFTHKFQGFTTFVHSCLCCPLLPMLSEDIPSQLVASVLSWQGIQCEQKKMQSVPILTSVLTECISNELYCRVISKFLLDLLASVYLILLHNVNDLEHIVKFAQVLHLGFAVVRNIKEKFFANQEQENINVVYQQIIAVTTKYCMEQGHGEGFVNKVVLFLQHILNLTNKATFTQKVSDLVVIVRRGY